MILLTQNITKNAKNFESPTYLPQTIFLAHKILRTAPLAAEVVIAA